MAYKSWKPKNNNYIDGAGIRVNRKTLLDYIFPVGSIYMSVNNVNPHDLFGGTWERLKQGFIYGANSDTFSSWGTGTYVSDAEGNTGSHILTINEMPSHNHAFRAVKDYINTDSGGILPKANNAQGNNQGWGNYGPTTGDNAIQNTGGGKGHTHSLNAHNHRVPYLAVLIWKRTA